LADGEPILASASSAGHIALWDLNAGGRLLHMIRGAHDGAISTVEWVPGQPVLITSGEDNSVKVCKYGFLFLETFSFERQQWLFDSPTAAPRLLKFRSGHNAPPHLIRYYGDDGKQLLTASRDRSLRCTSVVRDSRSFELSQGMACDGSCKTPLTFAMQDLLSKRQPAYPSPWPPSSSHL
jgi:U3 small nucleolar RNA-associated protein 21